jgi:2,5-diketo-D-gluconate reductase B
MSNVGEPTRGGVPLLGLGTYKNTDAEQCAESVETALELGYRHIDTAQFYHNECAVGRGIATSDVPRADVLLATKVWIDRLGYDDVVHSTRESLNRLGMETIDLLYIHWPADTYDPAETFRAFEHLHEEGLIDYVGLSNFTADQVVTAVDTCDAPIFANQVECHPFLPQTELRAACADHDVTVVAYAPLARGAVCDDPTLTDIAERHDATAAQVALAWLRQHDIVAIPKATGREHLRENWGSLDVTLSEEAVARIDDIDRRERLIDPDFAPW